VLVVTAFLINLLVLPSECSFGIVEEQLLRYVESSILDFITLFIFGNIVVSSFPFLEEELVLLFLRTLFSSIFVVLPIAVLLF
jgi:hypothetical protein